MIQMHCCTIYQENKTESLMQSYDYLQKSELLSFQPSSLHFL